MECSLNPVFAVTMHHSTRQWRDGVSFKRSTSRHKLNADSRWSKAEDIVLRTDWSEHIDIPRRRMVIDHGPTSSTKWNHWDRGPSQWDVAESESVTFNLFPIRYPQRCSLSNLRPLHHSKHDILDGRLSLHFIEWIPFSPTFSVNAPSVMLDRCYLVAALHHQRLHIMYSSIDLQCPSLCKQWQCTSSYVSCRWVDEMRFEIAKLLWISSPKNLNATNWSLLRFQWNRFRDTIFWEKNT